MTAAAGQRASGTRHTHACMYATMLGPSQSIPTSGRLTLYHIIAADTFALRNDNCAALASRPQAQVTKSARNAQTIDFCRSPHLETASS